MSDAQLTREQAIADLQSGARNMASINTVVAVLEDLVMPLRNRIEQLQIQVDNLEIQLAALQRQGLDD